MVRQNQSANIDLTSGWLSRQKNEKLASPKLTKHANFELGKTEVNVWFEKNLLSNLESTLHTPSKNTTSLGTAFPAD